MKIDKQEIVLRSLGAIGALGFLTMFGGLLAEMVRWLLSEDHSLGIVASAMGFAALVLVVITAATIAFVNDIRKGK